MSRIAVHCPECDSEDIRGHAGPGDTIEITCSSCGHRWDRVPSLVCPRCASTDVVASPWDGWRWDSRETGTWSHTEETDYRCLKCHKTWQSTHRTEPGDDYLTKDDLSEWTVAELREQAVEWGLDTAGLKKPDLIKSILREQENDHWSEEQLARMPKRALNRVARVFGVSIGRRSVPSLVAAILDRQQKDEAAERE